MDHSILNDDEDCLWKTYARSGRLVDSIKTLRTIYYLGYADAKVIYDWYVMVQKLKKSARILPEVVPEPVKYFIKLTDDTFIRVSRNVSSDDGPRFEKVKAYVANGSEDLLRLISDLSNA